MRLYCIDLGIVILTIALASIAGMGIGYIQDKTITEQENKILAKGYIKTSYKTPDELLSSPYEECIEFNRNFYCY